MRKRYIALALCAAFLASLAVSFSFAGDSEPEDDTIMIVNNKALNVDVEIELNGLSAERAQSAARELANMDIFGDPYFSELETGVIVNQDTEICTEEIPPTSPHTSDDLCPNGKHSIVTTTAYYTKHLAYDTDPRCAILTIKVTVCKKCSYIKQDFIAIERVSYCHPMSAVKEKGDVNADGKINAKDVTALMKHIVGAALPKGSLFDKLAADVDSSGRINARDVTLLMKKIVNSQKRR